MSEYFMKINSKNEDIHSILVTTKIRHFILTYKYGEVAMMKIFSD